MRRLVTSDLHLTDRPMDAYRFNLFGFLRDLMRKHDVRAVSILGDLTDAKNHHSAALTNRVTDELALLAKDAEVDVLRGNHDCDDPNNPFFRFLRLIPRVSFIVNPESYTTDNGERVLLLPHSRQPDRDWQSRRSRNGTIEADYIFMHQTVNGAKSETGHALDGIAADQFKAKRACISGDVHVPQKIGGVVYCGAPYHIHFGDRFDPRVLLIDDGKVTSIAYDSVRKPSITITSAKDLDDRDDLAKGDQVKLTMLLDKRDFAEWPAMKRAVLDRCKLLGLEVHGCDMRQAADDAPKEKEAAASAPVKRRSPAEIVRAFAKRNKLPDDVRDAGLGLLK